jgi:hypothetical protein
MVENTNNLQDSK